MNSYVKQGAGGSWLYPTSVVFFFIFYMVLVCPCCGSCQKKFPINVIFLALLTVSMAVMMGVIACYYSTKAVVMAAGTTTLVVGTVTGLTFWSKFDITKCW